MTTRVLIINLGDKPVNVDRVGGLDSWRITTLSPSKEVCESYVYEGSDIRITEVQEPEVLEIVRVVKPDVIDFSGVKL